MGAESQVEQSGTGDPLERFRRLTRAKLLRWVVRWALTGALSAALLPRYPRVMGLLYVLIPLGLLNLAMIVFLHLKLRRLATLLALHPELSREE